MLRSADGNRRSQVLPPTSGPAPSSRPLTSPTAGSDTSPASLRGGDEKRTFPLPARARQRQGPAARSSVETRDGPKASRYPLGKERESERVGDAVGGHGHGVPADGPLEGRRLGAPGHRDLLA